MKRLILSALVFVLVFALAACSITIQQKEDAAATPDPALMEAARKEAYAAGYADGHKEAQGHSEKYDELMRQAYQATGGAGAGFSRDAAGNVIVEETAPNGQKVWVYFQP